MRDTCVHLTRPLANNIWGEMQQQVYQVHDVDKLKQRLIDVWHSFEQRVNDDAVDEWRKRPCECICMM